MLIKKHEELARELIKVSKEVVDIRGVGKSLPVGRLSRQGDPPFVIVGFRKTIA